MPLTGVLDSQELRHSIRDLVALSTLPAIWKAYDPQQIADSVAAALLTMLDLGDRLRFPPERTRGVGHRDHQDRRHLGRVGQRHPRSLAGMAAERVVEPSGKCSPAWAKHPFSRLLLPSALAAMRSLWLAPAAPTFPAKPNGFCWASPPTRRRSLSNGGMRKPISGALLPWWRIRPISSALPDWTACRSTSMPPACGLVGLGGLADAARLHVLDFLMPKEVALVRDELWPRVMRDGRWVGELDFRHFKTGAAIPFLVDWFRIDDPRRGCPINVATVSRDLTAQKRAEAELRHLNETLEHRVAERTSELAEAHRKLVREGRDRELADARLQEVRQELFHAARLSAAGQMAAALAHELSQPLTAAANSVARRGVYWQRAAKGSSRHGR